jgi:hypothetical protein
MPNVQWINSCISSGMVTCSAEPVHHSQWLFDIVQEVRKLFVQPEVLPAEQLPPLVWKAPDEDALVLWLVNDKQFSEDRVRSAVTKMNAAKSKSSQNRLESFFKVGASQGRAMYTVQRARMLHTFTVPELEMPCGMPGCPAAGEICMHQAGCLSIAEIEQHVLLAGSSVIQTCAQAHCWKTKRAGHQDEGDRCQEAWQEKVKAIIFPFLPHHLLNVVLGH